MFLLTWISHPAMRQQVTAMTNQVEGYHSFSKGRSFGGEVIAENDPDEQQKHIRYNDLLASAVILQNVIDRSKIIEDLRREGWTITDEDLSFLSPYWQAVKRFGEYGLDFDRAPDPEDPGDPLAPEASSRAGWIRRDRQGGLIYAARSSDSDRIWRGSRSGLGGTPVGLRHASDSEGRG
jgi:hypothetical protein